VKIIKKLSQIDSSYFSVNIYENVIILELRLNI